MFLTGGLVFNNLLDTWQLVISLGVSTSAFTAFSLTIPLAFMGKKVASSLIICVYNYVPSRKSLKVLSWQSGGRP